MITHSTEVPFSLVPVNQEQNEECYYPKERRATYYFDGIKYFGQQLSFRTKDQNALFYNVTLTTEQEKKGIALHSEFIATTERFLKENNIPIRGIYSDCTYYSSSGFAHYHTTDIEVCKRLSNILCRMNSFNFTGLDNTVYLKFFNSISN